MLGGFGRKKNAHKTDYGQKAKGVLVKGVKALGTALVVGAGVAAAAGHAKNSVDRKIDAASLLADEGKAIGERAVDKAKANPLLAKQAVEGGVDEAKALARVAKVAGVEKAAKNLEFQREVRSGKRREALDDRVVKAPKIAEPFEDIVTGRKVGGAKAGGSRDVAREGGGSFDARICKNRHKLNLIKRETCLKQHRRAAGL